IISSLVEKVKQNEPLAPGSAKLLKRALVIGGGVAGIHAALDIANNGYEVTMVEKKPYIGGRMAQLSETFPTQESTRRLLSPKIAQVLRHPLIKLFTRAEVEAVSGSLGDFTARIKLKPALVNRATCTGCKACLEACPVTVDSKFNSGISTRKAIYIPLPLEILNKPVIDTRHCLHLKDKSCRACAEVCEAGAIDFEQSETIVEEKFGAMIISTGYDLYPKEKFGEYGYGQFKDVINGLEFERLNALSGPTGGKLLRPSDGTVPQEIVFVQCAGSRDPENHLPYCSKICCMYTAKQTLMFKRKIPEGQAYVFYMDNRAGGKGYEEFLQKAMEEGGAFYLRGRVSKVFKRNGKLVVWGVDTLTGKQIEIEADMVVLATAIVPRADADALAKSLTVSTGEFGFQKEAHVKLRPVESTTRGIFFAGCSQGPKDITDTISQAGCAANKILGLFSAETLQTDPVVARLSVDICRGCGLCVAACPYDAREIDPQTNTAVVKEALCQGCGGCVSACSNKACELKNWTMEQIFHMIDIFE
ncbi:MAG: CoB--CoM heterodisulfide reductase iron-sulfur subunit A family protein, partial [bacterium]|nr:CoB--CoM heterodisulfide reductase iron-sulfur subunit A family protein [bacterium]